MPLWVCEGSQHNVGMVSQSRVKELGRVSVVQLGKVLPYFVIFVDTDTFHAVPTYSDEDMEAMSAVDTVRYHFYFVKRSYSLLDAIHFLPNFSLRFLTPSFASIEKGPQSVLKEA